MDSYCPIGAPVSLMTNFLAKGTINDAVTRATGNAVTHAFSQIVKKCSMNPILIAVMENDMTRLIPREMMRLINRLAYFG